MDLDQHGFPYPCPTYEQLLKDRILDLQEENERLMKELTQYRDMAREQATWSLGGGMVEAMFAGAELQKRVEKDS